MFLQKADTIDGQIFSRIHVYSQMRADYRKAPDSAPRVMVKMRAKCKFDKKEITPGAGLIWVLAQLLTFVLC